MFIKEFFSGIRCYSRAARVISGNRLWLYISVPGILSILYISLLIILGALFFTDFSLYINANFIPGFIQGQITQVIIAVILWLLLLIIGFITYKEVVLIFFSPILSYLSERVEKLVYGQDPPAFNLKNLAKDIIRGLALSLRNLLLMLGFTLFAWLISFIPVIGTAVSPFLILFIQSFYGGAGLADYTLERKRYSVYASVDFARSNRARITGVGLGFILLLMIPVIGWFAAPGYGTVAATLAVLEKLPGPAFPAGGGKVL